MELVPGRLDYVSTGQFELCHVMARVPFSNSLVFHLHRSPFDFEKYKKTPCASPSDALSTQNFYDSLFSRTRSRRSYPSHIHTHIGRSVGPHGVGFCIPTYPLGYPWVGVRI